MKKPARLGEIELLRVLAATLVVCYHIRQNMAVPAPWSRAQGLHPGDNYPYQGSHGFEMFMTNIDVIVDFFFVVSAFLVTGPWARAIVRGRAMPSLRGTYVNRFVRLIPLYYGLILVIWTMRNHGYPGEWLDLVEHLTFTQWLDSHRIFYTDGPAWSLAIEAWFYVLGPLAMVAIGRCVRRVGSPALRAFLSSLPLLVLIGGSEAWKYCVDDVWHIRGDQWAFRFSLPAKLDDICLGMVLALLVAALGERKMPALAGILLRVAAVASLVWFLSHRVADLGLWNTYAHTAGGVASALLVFAIAVSRQGRLARLAGHRLIEKLGLVTFALYISHEALLDPLNSLGLFSKGESAYPRNVLIGVTAAWLFAWLLHSVVELPFLRLRGLWDARGRAVYEDYDGLMAPAVAHGHAELPVVAEVPAAVAVVPAPRPMPAPWNADGTRRLTPRRTVA